MRSGGIHELRMEGLEFTAEDIRPEKYAGPAEDFVEGSSES